MAIPPKMARQRGRVVSATAQRAEAAVAAGGEKWCIGATAPQKVVHRRACSSARLDYTWARQYPTVETLAAALVEGRADRWHRFCQRCCGDLDDAVQAARIARRSE